MDLALRATAVRRRPNLLLQICRTKILIRRSPNHPIKKPREGLFYWVAGGPGFEPGLAESASAVRPLDDPPSVCSIVTVGDRRGPIRPRACGRPAGCPIRLALRELGCAACLSQADLLALNLARVARHESGF